MSLKPDDLAQVILDSIDDDEPPTALYTLNIHEARMLARAVRNAARPHLTADDLRNTPAGKQLLAEGWDRGVADNERGWEHVYSGHDVDPDDPLAMCQTCETTNPYRTEAPGDAPEG